MAFRTELKESKKGHPRLLGRKPYKSAFSKPINPFKGRDVIFDLQSHKIGCANTINRLEWPLGPVYSLPSPRRPRSMRSPRECHRLFQSQFPSGRQAGKATDDGSDDVTRLSDCYRQWEGKGRAGGERSITISPMGPNQPFATNTGP